MNAVTLSNIQLNNPIFKTQFPSKPSFSKPSFRRRSFRRLIRRSSLVIETGVEEDPGRAFSEEDEAEAPSSPTESVARRLILLRHAKSSWRDRSLRDHDRPLSKTGQADAIKVAHKLQEMGWIPQLILSSDALRTRETLKIMQKHVEGFLEAEVQYVSSFYSVAAMDGQTAEHLQHVICRYSSDDIVTVMCMGHNRGWEEAASMFTGASVELKTCNAALLETTGKSWTEAFALAGLGGWKLHGIVKPSS
ncbi:Histidine phosphatase [Trema orientale]|uniref:Histidine phosphatase n=1 Tax=Trema orientale TaxID=63057 RepID=A0A2P5DY71_TREOI|nr:Histidine phosphatase [Trema orientale]